MSSLSMDQVPRTFPSEQILLGVTAYGHSFGVPKVDAFSKTSDTLALYAPFGSSVHPGAVSMFVALILRQGEPSTFRDLLSKVISLKAGML